MIYYDSLAHQVNINSTVMFHSVGKLFYGTIIDILDKENGSYKFVIIPNIRVPKNVKPHKKYTINPNNVYLIKVKRKGE